MTAMATRADVARLAGVSEAAVSYAISGKRTISAATRERVFSAMEQLNYRPNAMATGLAGGKSKIIALLFPTRERGISNADLEYVLGAANASRELGYHLLLWPTDDRDVEEARQLHKTGLIDGVLLMEVRLADERVTYLREGGVPVGLIGRTADPADTLYADRDFAAVTELAVEHLTSLGHTQLAFVDGSESAYQNLFGAVRRAEEGYRLACERRGLDVRIFHTESSITAGRALYTAQFTEKSGITGVVGMNAEATIGLLASATEDRSRVPKKLSLISIATPTDFVASTSPELTTISPPAEEIGRTAARMLLNQLGDLQLEPEQQLWIGDLVVRGTTGPAPRDRREP
jgi:DNA-binding LacI/PurR family transcriptional regulator